MGTTIPGHWSMDSQRSQPWGLLAAYIVVGLAFASTLVYTLYKEPLFPFNFDSLSWCQAWLSTTVGDYYVLGFGISTIVWQTEDNKLWATMWILLINLLGSPCFMAYLFFRVNVNGAAGIQMKGAGATQSGTAFFPTYMGDPHGATP